MQMIMSSKSKELSKLPGQPVPATPVRRGRAEPPADLAGRAGRGISRSTVQRHRDALAVEHQPDLEPHRACSCPCMAAIANYPWNHGHNFSIWWRAGSLDDESGQHGVHRYSKRDIVAAATAGRTAVGLDGVVAVG